MPPLPLASLVPPLSSVTPALARFTERRLGFLPTRSDGPTPRCAPPLLSPGPAPCSGPFSRHPWFRPRSGMIMVLKLRWWLLPGVEWMLASVATEQNG